MIVTDGSNFKTFNQTKFLSNFSQMNELAIETINTFLSTLPTCFSNIESAIDLNDGKAVELAAHTIKGSVSNFFADEAFRLAGLMESQGQSQDLHETRHTWILLKRELYLLSLELKKTVQVLKGTKKS